VFTQTHYYDASREWCYGEYAARTAAEFPSSLHPALR